MKSFRFDCSTTSRGGGTQHIRIRGGQSKKFSGDPKMSLQLPCNQKISAHFIYINLYMNIKYPQTMQIEVRNASIEPRNINMMMFGIEKYHEHSFSFLWTQKYHSDPKTLDLPPRMCMCRVPPGHNVPPPLHRSCDCKFSSATDTVADAFICNCYLLLY